MTSQEVDRFTELLCSRLCHDLISPIGAINNGLELVAEGDTRVLDDAISLIGASSRQASARLAYFRLAFGAWGTEAAMAFDAFRKVVEDHFDDRRCPVSWAQPPAGAHIVVDKPLGKLILNLLLIAAECAQREARVEVRLDGGVSRKKVSIAVRGERCRLRDDVRSGFSDETASGELTVRNVIAYHCRRLCASLGLDLSVADHSPNSIEFTAG